MDTKELNTDVVIDSAADGLIEALKFLPEGAIESAIVRVQARISTADFKGDPDPLKILHSAVKIGVEVSKTTETKKDDKAFAEGEQFLSKLEENGGNIFGALLHAVFTPPKKGE